MCLRFLQIRILRNFHFPIQRGAPCLGVHLEYLATNCNMDSVKMAGIYQRFLRMFDMRIQSISSECSVTLTDKNRLTLTLLTWRIW